ncbi:MAG: hypothetical protein MUC98_07195 [Desulfobacterota bacterium]|jgi:hypothetical protein|nr:hypothetical protein [Thermodesulfobacteriota bacterium]
MLDSKDLIAQVRHNCSISDCRYAGTYSVCGLALRLRDLYKWEKGLEPWVEADSSVVLQWIGEKEDEWDRLEEEEFGRISVAGTTYDPFDVEGLNAVLMPHGLFYGAGYVQGLKPSFLLAELLETRTVEGFPVHVLGREHARDLMTVPALSQERAILIRKESARIFLWNLIFFLKKSSREALRFALETYGIPDHHPKALKENFDRICEEEIEAYIYHEVGELKDVDFDREVWRNLLGAFPHTIIEFFARALKDILADTNDGGKLAYIVRQRKTASLGLYAAFLDGLRKLLFPEFMEAFGAFKETRDWERVEEARRRGYGAARERARRITEIFRSGPPNKDMGWMAAEIEKSVLEPLGLLKWKSEAED